MSDSFGFFPEEPPPSTKECEDHYVEARVGFLQSKQAKRNDLGMESAYFYVEAVRWITMGKFNRKQRAQLRERAYTQFKAQHAH